MRFVCDQCGKKYSTAEAPAPDKVYKLKCKACGHLIVVKGQAGTSTAIAAPTLAEIAAAQASEPLLTPMPEPKTRAASPEPLDRVPGLAIELLSPTTDTDATSRRLDVPRAADSAAADWSDLSAPRLELEEPPARTSALPDQDLIPPPPEKDELADFAAAATEVLEAPSATGEAGRPEVPGYRDIFDERDLEEATRDPFMAAARSSLPDHWTGVPPVVAPPIPRPAPPSLAPSKQERLGLGGVPIAIIGVGLLALVGITAWALIGRGGPPAPPLAEASQPIPAPPRLAEPVGRPPVPPPLAVKEPEPLVPEPPGAEKKLAPVADAKPEPVAEEKPEPGPVEKPGPRARPPEKKIEKKVEPRLAERRPEPPRPLPAEEPRAEPGEVEPPGSAAALTQEVLDRVVGANRKAFATCIATAGNTGVTLDGRRVALRITVNTNGTVAYPTLDDQSLNTIELGQCLKSAARLMIFPRFKGDPFHYEVPLVLGTN